MEHFSQKQKLIILLIFILVLVVVVVFLVWLLRDEKKVEPEEPMGQGVGTPTSYPDAEVVSILKSLRTNEPGTFTLKFAKTIEDNDNKTDFTEAVIENPSAITVSNFACLMNQAPIKLGENYYCIEMTKEGSVYTVVNLIKMQKK